MTPMPNQPPAIATWLLTHFGCSRTNEAVIGDLAERHREGRSRFWYWRQVFIAIGKSLVTEIRLHKFLAVRALLIGNAFKFVSLFALTFVSRWWLGVKRTWQLPNPVAMLLVITGAVLCAANVNLAAWLSRPHQRPISFLFFISELLPIFLPVRHFMFGVFWLDGFVGLSNVLLWNSSGITALDRICNICTTPKEIGRAHV